MITDLNKFRFSVRFWTEISAETKRCNDTETEMHTETEISAETDTETEIFRSLITINNSRSFYPSYFSFSLRQRFSTWGTRTPRGTRAVCRGYAKF